MPLYIPPQPLPNRNFGKVWTALTSYVSRPGTELSRFVKTWQMGNGSDKDAIDPEVWSADLMPLVRLELGGGASAPFTQVSSASHVTIGVTIAVVGRKTSDITDFWESFVTILMPGDKSLYAPLKALSVMNYSVSQPAFAPRNFSDTFGQTASGKILLNYEFKSQV